METMKSLKIKEIKSKTIAGDKCRQTMYLCDNNTIMFKKFVLCHKADENEVTSVGYTVVKRFKDYILIYKIYAFKNETFNEFLGSLGLLCLQVYYGNF
jgi:hypothetical protein